MMSRNRFDGNGRAARCAYATGAPAAMLVALALAAGCGGSLVNVNLNVVGEQTALEKQVLGTYRSLGEDLMIYSSVRGVDPEGGLKVPPQATASQRAACDAMRNRQYNRDDIDRLRRAGLAGEGRDGMLALRPEQAGQGLEELTAAQVTALIEEENRDRRAVLDRLIETTPGVTGAQRASVAWIFAGLNQDAAPAGAWVQNEDGSWRRK